MGFFLREGFGFGVIEPRERRMWEKIHFFAFFFSHLVSISNAFFGWKPLFKLLFLFQINLSVQKINTYCSTKKDSSLKPELKETDLADEKKVSNKTYSRAVKKSGCTFLIYLNSVRSIPLP
jgi:hypothetical protein